MSGFLNILFSLLQGHYNKLSEEEKQILEALMNDEGQIPTNIGIDEWWLLRKLCSNQFNLLPLSFRFHWILSMLFVGYQYGENIKQFIDMSQGQLSGKCSKVYIIKYQLIWGCHSAINYNRTISLQETTSHLKAIKQPYLKKRVLTKNLDFRMKMKVRN